jgi:hypothetical protein
MITGGYNEAKSPEARNARPFFWRRPSATIAPSDGGFDR